MLDGGQPSVSTSEWTLVLPSLTVGAGAAGARAPRSSSAELVESFRLPAIHTTGPLSARGGGNDRVWEVQESAREAMKGRLSNLRLGELNRHRQLQKDFARLRLSEYFDDRGSPRFRRLGMTVAAKHQPSVQDSFGSKGSDMGTLARKPQNAKACMLAMSAVEKDLDLRHQRSAKLAERISETERLQINDVRCRQMEVLFAEIPKFDRYMPPGVEMVDIQPSEDPTKAQEMKERRLIETANHNLSDKSFRMGFSLKLIFSRSEALVLSHVVGLWASATRGRACCPMGMDRPSFCRMLLDLGLVDQVKVPFFWAVSLFDEAAHNIRCLPSLEVQLAAAAPFVPIASRWHVVLILDVICRQHFNHKTKDIFLGSLLQIARQRLPPHVIEGSGLKDETFATLAEGREVAGIDSFTFDSVGKGGGGHRRTAGPEAEGGGDATAVRAGSKDTGGGATPLSPSSESRRPTTPWHRYLGKPAGPEDVQAEESASDFLVRCMLVEPEVLHVLAQYRGLFQHLHASYAEEKDNLSFMELHQLCRDFHLTPNIVPPHMLQTLYESAECVELLPKPPTPPGSAIPTSRKRTASVVSSASAALPGRTKQRSRARAAKGSIRSPPSPSSPEPESPRTTMRNRRASRSDKGSTRLPPAPSSPEPESPKTTMRNRRASRSDKGGARSPAASETSLEPKSPRRPEGRRASPEPSRGVRVSPVAEDFTSERGSVFSVAATSDTCSVATAILTGKKVWPTALPWEGIAEAAQRAAERAANSKPEKRPRRRHPTAFGPNALAETLCRACFTYLGAYATPKQQSMSGYLRVIWMMAYLREVSSHLRASLEKRQVTSSEVAEAAAPRALRRALEGLPEGFWTEPAPVPEAMLLEAPTVFHPGLPNGETDSALNKAKRRQFLMASEAGGGAIAAAESGGADAQGGDVEARGSSKQRASRRSRNAGGAATQSSRSPEADPHAPSGAAADAGALGAEAKGGPGGARLGVASSRSPCVVDGQCRLCQRLVGGVLWGNPGCRGCALTDTMSFKHHPLHRLLVGWPPGISLQPRAATKPAQAERNALTPPPMASANTLRPPPPDSPRGSVRKRTGTARTLGSVSKFFVKTPRSDAAGGGEA